VLRAARVDPATGPTPEVGMIASRLAATDQGATVWAAAQTVGSHSIRQALSTAVWGRLARFRHRWRWAVTAALPHCWTEWWDRSPQHLVVCGDRGEGARKHSCPAVLCKRGDLRAGDGAAAAGPHAAADLEEAAGQW
jgi:hypothetical protein